MKPEDEVSPATIANIAWDVRDGTADQADIDRVLRYFCALVEAGMPLPIELREYLKDSFLAYLQNPRVISVDQGLGLTRRRAGRPTSDPIEQRILAARLLERRAQGYSHQEALEDVAEAHDCKKTKVGEAWRKFKGEAITYLLIARKLPSDEKPISKTPISEEEWQRIRKIYRKDHAALERWFSEQPPTITPKK